MIKIINKITAKILKFFIHKPKITLGAVFALFVALGIFAPRLAIDTNSESLMLENDPSLKEFYKISQTYSGSNFLMLAFLPENEDVFSGDSIAEIEKIADELLAINGVKSVLHLANAPLFKSSPNLAVNEILAQNITLKSPLVDLELAKKELLNHPFFTQNIISKNSKVAGIVAYFEDDLILAELNKQKQIAQNNKNEKEAQKISKQIIDHKHKQALIESKIVEQIKNIKSQKGQIALGGLLMISSDMIDYVKRDLRVYGGLLSFILALMLYIFFRRIRFVALIFLVCAFVLIVSSGIYALCGFAITIVSSNFVSLLLIISVSLCVHLCARYCELFAKYRRASQSRLVSAALLSKVSPSFFAVFTTIIGFLSLVFSNIEPIIKLGAIMSIGVGVALFAALAIFGSFMMLLQKPHSLGAAPLAQWRFLDFCSNLAIRKKPIVIFIAFLFILFAFYGIPKLKVENSFVNYFKDGNEIKNGLLVIDRNLGGTIGLDVVVDFAPKSLDSIESSNNLQSNTSANGAISSEAAIESEFLDDFESEFSSQENSQKYWFSAQKLRIAQEIHNLLAQNEFIGSVMSLHSLDLLVSSLQMPLSNELAMSFLYENAPNSLKEQVFSPYVSLENNQMHFSARVFDSDSKLRRNELISELNTKLGQIAQNENVEIRLNGILVLYNNLLQSLVSSQVNTLAFVVGVIFLVFLVIFRSLKLAFIAILVNIIPLGALFGFLGASGLALDLMGVTIAAICIGIGVDNAIHYIYRYKIERRLGLLRSADSMNFKEILAHAIHNSHRSVGGAMYYTTSIIVVGFCAMMSSNFTPTIYFGALTTLVMLLMLISSLILLPALILILEKQGATRGVR